MFLPHELGQVARTHSPRERSLRRQFIGTDGMGVWLLLDAHGMLQEGGERFCDSERTRAAVTGRKTLTEGIEDMWNCTRMHTAEDGTAALLTLNTMDTAH